MAFTTPSYPLADLFARINTGELQLPDFQRQYVWEVGRIRSLLVSVLRGYPIGALLALDTRNQETRFRSRPFLGALHTEEEPGLLLLDGQQRLTSLYQTLRGDGFVDTVDFRKKRIRRRFFVDVRTAVSADIMPQESVFTVDEHGGVRSHFGPEIEANLHDRQVAVDNLCVPVDKLLLREGSAMLFDMAAGANEADMAALKEFNARVVTPLTAYDVPMIRVGRETARAGVGSIFAQVNEVGLQMDIFDLLSAVFGAEDPAWTLSEDWSQTEEILRKYPALDDIDRVWFLRGVSLLVTARKGRARGQREDILRLHLDEYRQVAGPLREGFVKAAQFLSDRCILSVEQVPYTAQLVPLAVIYALIEDQKDLWAKPRSVDRLNRWFWSGVFGELYGSTAVTIRMGRDVDEVARWVLDPDENAPEPKTVRDASFNESRLLSIDESTGVWHGLYALLMARGALDWRTGEPFTPETYEELGTGFHRVFPTRWCVENGVDQVLVDSILNRTPMSKRTEIVVDGNNPARYLARFQGKSLLDDAEFDAMIESHEISPELLLESRPNEFFANRRERFVGMIEYAMDKPVVRDVDDQDADYSSGDEGPRAFSAEG